MSTAVFVLTLDEIDGVSVIMPQVKKEWAEQIVFVDGGSTDGTVEKAKELGFEVIHQQNKGEGMPAELVQMQHNLTISCFSVQMGMIYLKIYLN